MTVLSLDYRCCDRLTPLYLRHAEVAAVAAAAREQLVDADAIPLDVLRGIEALAVNGLEFNLWVDTEHPITDEEGQPVLGVCEFDPGAGADAALLSVSPPRHGVTKELVLSTFGHELGHGIFDAPGWIVASKLGPGLFGHAGDGSLRIYRTLTPDLEHLHPASGTVEDTMGRAGNPAFQAERERRFAELRANEFMGSLLVPRDRLIRAAVELAPEFDVEIERGFTLFDELIAASPRLMVEGPFGFIHMERLQRVLAKRFGVHRRFIAVRMERYGLLAGAKPR